MKLLEGTQEVPVIYTAHHASHDFGEFEERVALTAEQKLRFSDYGTDITVPLNGLVAVVAGRSRALGDLNRDPDDHGRFQPQDYAKPVRHNIWKPGQELTEDDELYCQSNFYAPFHNEIVDRLKARNDLTFVVAWDNTAHYIIGEDSGGDQQTMRPFILSNRGLENSTEASTDESTSCDPKFLEMLARNFVPTLEVRGLPTEVVLNFVFKGGYICRRYSTLRNKADLRELGISCAVQSLQLEYDTAITHDQATLEPKTEKIIAVREAFSEAINKTIRQYSQDS